jgi:hypothetical protein
VSKEPEKKKALTEFTFHKYPNDTALLAEGRVRLYVATGDEGYLKRPHMRLVYLNAWEKEWEEDLSVPEMAYELAGERGLLK